MVFSGDKRSGEEQRDTSDNEHMERLKPLHNFDLPYLKWGNQKLLRCMKVDSNEDASIVVRNQSPETGGVVIGTRRKGSDFEKNRFRSSGNNNNNNNNKVFSSEKVTERINVDGDGEMSATREKLMIDFQKQVGEMKDAILGTTTTSFESPVTNGDGDVLKPNSSPWNLRTRRAACKAPRCSLTNAVNGNGEVIKPNCSSPVINGDGEKRERTKFSVALSRRELEEDFMAMAGRRLPRKPKKRPRIIQKQLDTLFPGLWLSEITADLYKVPDEADNGKR